jgi:hypothetical protein
MNILASNSKRVNIRFSFFLSFSYLLAFFLVGHSWVRSLGPLVVHRGSLVRELVGEDVGALVA